MRDSARHGFTLIEISIVLLIIGLLVGGILVGRELIHAAEIGATISQVQKYQMAANTFRLKYNALPGDIPEPNASSFGFKPRGSYAGEGDGNGVLEGIQFDGPDAIGSDFATGENIMFWVDLSAANLISGGFATATLTSNQQSVSGNDIDLYLPKTRLNANYVYVWSGGTGINQGIEFNNGLNYFSIAAFPIDLGLPYNSRPGLSAFEAYSIDMKLDDGLPQSGVVIALYVQNGPVSWAAGNGFNGASFDWDPTTAATSASDNTCYDNGNIDGETQRYSTSWHGGNLRNCAVSIRFH